MAKINSVLKQEDLVVKTLGKPTVKSPLRLSAADGSSYYVTEQDRILYDINLSNFKQCMERGEPPVSFEKSGPREYIYFDPVKTKVAVVTCGGLCPGLNNVIRSMVNHIWYRYGVKRIIGIQYGYEGFISSYQHPVIDLNPDFVDDIHLSGGSVLGSSRGNQDVGQIVDTLEILNINILFCIGGDGTLRGALDIHEEITKRKLKIGVACIPKTIDNDINLIEKSFGFETAFTIANDIIRNAHNEAVGAYNGISLIKLMGRDSGFIAVHAALSIQEVNFVLIPEMDFELHGPYGFLKALRKRLENRHHALVVVAD